jgi:hypothetical protein
VSGYQAIRHVCQPAIKTAPNHPCRMLIEFHISEPHPCDLGRCHTNIGLTWKLWHISRWVTCLFFEQNGFEYSARHEAPRSNYCTRETKAAARLGDRPNRLVEGMSSLCNSLGVDRVASPACRPTLRGRGTGSRHPSRGMFHGSHHCLVQAFRRRLCGLPWALHPPPEHQAGERGQSSSANPSPVDRFRQGPGLWTPGPPSPPES